MANAYGDGPRVYTWDNEEWVVANGPEDADRVYTEEMHSSIREQTGEPGEWVECDPAKEFTLVNGEGPNITASFADHAERHGRGYFGSANY